MNINIFTLFVLVLVCGLSSGAPNFEKRQISNIIGQQLSAANSTNNKTQNFVNGIYNGGNFGKRNQYTSTQMGGFYDNTNTFSANAGSFQGGYSGAYRSGYSQSSGGSQGSGSSNVAHFQGGHFVDGNFGKREIEEPVTIEKRQYGQNYYQGGNSGGFQGAGSSNVAHFQGGHFVNGNFGKRDIEIENKKKCPSPGSVLSQETHDLAIKDNCVLLGVVVSEKFSAVNTTNNNTETYVSGIFYGGNFGKRAIEKTLSFEKRQYGGNIAYFQGGHFENGNFGKREIEGPLSSEKRQFGTNFDHFSHIVTGKRLLETHDKVPIKEKQRRQSRFHSTHSGGTFSNSNFNSGAELLGGYLGKGSHSNCKGCWTEAEFGPNGKK